MKNQLTLFIKKRKSDLLVFLMILCGVLCSFSAQAQVKTIQGVISDEVGIPLPGATVMETGTKNGVTSDFDGNYTIQVNQGASITISYVGYTTKVVLIQGEKSTYNIGLDPDFQQLDDVVVVGFGTVRKKDLTGSVASVKMDKLTEAPVANFDQALAGRVTGVQVGSDTGEPGAGLQITIRGGNTINGDNSPLYVLDGFIIENFNPGILNPTDIQSIDILKDASATAIYGARGANGVVLITTKQAKSGKTRISYETRLDVKNVANKLEVLDAYEFVKLADEINPSSASEKFFGDDSGAVVGGVEDYLNAPTANWQDEAFKTAYTKSHTMKVASGSEATKLDASINLVNDEGTLLKSEFKKINGRLNLRHKVNDKLDFNLNTIYANTERLGLDTEGTSSYSFMRNLITYPNVVNKFKDYGDSNPLYGINPDEFDVNNIFNWHPIVSLNNEYRKRETNQFIANLSVKYRITRNLDFEAKGGYNGDFRQTGVFNNSNTVYGRLINPINGINGTMDYQNYKTLSNINTLTYRNSFGKHNLNVLVGSSLNSRKITRTFIRSIQIPKYAESQGINAMDEGTLSSTDDLIGSSEERIQSLLGRLTYAYDNKYLLTASIRRDGSSKFGPGHNIGYFPSLALSWKAEEEEFIKNLGFISQLKFKGGYGKTGNDRIPGDARFDLFTSNLASYFLNGSEVLGQRPTSSGANPDIEWETTSQYNAGVDLGLFNGRIAITAEVYEKTTDDLLINADTPPSLGISSVWKNSGTVRNRGLELALSTSNVKSKNFRWTTDFNISFNQNKVLSLPEGKPIFGNPNYYWRYASNQYIVEEGKPLGNMFGYISDGVYQPEDFANYNEDDASHTLIAGQPDYDGGSPIRQPGDEKYKDLNGDGKITPDDKTIIGNGLPKHFGGLGNTFSYKGLELSAFFQWSYGNDVMNANRLIFEEMTHSAQNQYASVKNRWTPTNQDTDMFRALGRGFEDVSSRVIEDGSYIRLKTVNLSYAFSKKVLDKLQVNSLSIFLSGQNLITWTDYSGFDPDVSVNRSAIMPGVDYSSYPVSRTFSLGLNITF
ncbi:TonB-linked outer membrane protein, SusC/RagA family [Arenibacter nanhaiticus]|uniref:TonB-linked outer membrane protein, SusC/RagA family n=1 Tax=Arenibacter nanhaiticus TaxID=558155 RepID=A0A1M6HB00_9FLAO|nr:TonB-dependent receptor [Arenibacter nanhaiticus]SHJ19407.1 TonB-linked outer membrane protein, SusC/RagA family [Arenibacter nanhaiticus]